MALRTDSMTKSKFSVGDRVKTRHSVDPDLAQSKWPLEAGTIAQEFEGFDDISTTAYGRGWGLLHRWAIALDGGPLVFRDDVDLESE
ncbi:hypothetical protein BFN03_13540 [Rhodococcus sp. WMMA185]|uniref:hypothetical protein n=1 Tax=Rhodococcus sp. WMMA185 TaxID=679318 RepID=UPI000878DF3B|nr:hypothetical protein [Rhodococcus sp. WMMA185]AOW93326.1 hypothetical protein BFN03_13540 [Rhodococcus sp. WMMA185]